MNVLSIQAIEQTLNTPTETTSLAELVFPSLGVCDLENMYFRLSSGRGLYSYSRNSLALDAYGSVQFDTYFNSFSVTKWKASCEIKSLLFTIDFCGHISLVFSLHRFGRPSVKIYEVLLEHGNRTQCAVDLPFWLDLQEGMLAAEIHALTRSEIFGASFSTAEPPPNSVSLGIVVTTFGRQRYVARAIERLSGELFADARFSGRIKLVVVDNGQNLDAGTNEHVTIIRNPNLGGAGGFTRGLIHLQDCATFSHCLFMDDDATCEVESIRRTFRLLQYCKNKKTAVSGAMLREDRMHIQYENGARFVNGSLRPILGGLDLSKRKNLLINELGADIDYAGWWFFAFPLDIVTHYAFPFFVKGDDWTFCIQHRPKIVSMNGIASWQADFESKNSPITAYLYTRAIIVTNLILDNKASKYRIAGRFLGDIYKNSCGYNYERARAICEAVSDTLKGPAFWRNNVNMTGKLKHLRSIVVNEVPKPATGATAQAHKNKSSSKRKPPKWRTLYKRILLNGHLVPVLFFSRKEPLLEARMAPAIQAVFRKKRVRYYMENTMTYYAVEHSKKQFFVNLIIGLSLYAKFLLRFNRLREDYRKSYPELTSRSFWQQQFCSPSSNQ